MTLPLAALERLVQPLRSAVVLPRSARDWHTLPVEPGPWRVPADAVASSAAAVRQACALPDRTFDGLRAKIAAVLRERSRAADLLLSLQPFEAYDPGRADQLLDILDLLPAAVTTAVQAGSPVPADILHALEEASAWWGARESSCPPGHGLRLAFGLREDPTDGTGRFRPELVLQHYAHQGDLLLRRLVPHLASLGLPHVKDVLAGLSIVGRILTSPDPVFAYVAADLFIGASLTADQETAEPVRGYLLASEPALRRTEQAAQRAIRTADASDDDTEARAHAIADAYKRYVEGGFRRFGWALHCLQVGQWSEPPTLGPLRDRLIAEGGALSRIADVVVLPGMRNSETHESRVWDGFAEQFLTEDGPVPFDRARTALLVASSFTHGAEAGLTAISVLDASNAPFELPMADEVGRMPTEDRVRAFFGANRLTLMEARLNSPHARFRVQRLEMVDINPCLEALLLARRLLTRTESFEVDTIDADGPRITVDAGALDAAMPAWEYAVARLDQMPLSTFLPANLSARRRMESETAALRAVAWIAVDDAVGALDESPDRWDAVERRVLRVRLRIIAIAIDCTRRLVATGTPRLDSVHDSVTRLRRWIRAAQPVSPQSAEGQAAVQRLRSQWDVWGPVPRLPAIAEQPAPNVFSQPPPQLRMLEPGEYQNF